MTTQLADAAFAASQPRQATFVVYINGLEVPAKSASLRYGVWQMPEMQIEMVADPILARLGSEDRVQVAVFYYDDCDVDKSVIPAFRLFGEGEITGWGYRNTSNGRSIVFTVVNQIAIFTQLFVQFMTTVDDMIGHATHPGDVSGYAVSTNQIVYPFALFQQGLVPGAGSNSPTDIVRPFDFLYNAVRGMMAANVPDPSRTVPAANFFTRWARLTNFHNRFAASPFFDEPTPDNAHVFPVLRALQNTAAIGVVINNLIPNIQNAGSIWDMLQLVYTTMLMEVSMIPGMPLVTVDLSSSLVQPTNFGEHTLSLADSAAIAALQRSASGNPPPNGGWIPTLPDASRKKNPKRMQNYFPKPQMLFSIPPSCNVLFPSQTLSIAYDENYATQPTRLYFNDELVPTAAKIPQTGVGQAISNALAIGWPLEVDAAMRGRDLQHPTFTGKNFLLYPEEFFKGPVMDRRKTPPWLDFLGKSSDVSKTGTSGAQTSVADNPSAAGQLPSPAAASAAPPRSPSVPDGVMDCSNVNVGTANPDGSRKFSYAVEALRPRVATLAAKAGVPADFALAWISHESGGSIKSLTTLNERGYFQIMGPHVDPSSGEIVSLAQSEAGRLGLTIADTGATGPRTNRDPDPYPGANLSNDPTLSIDAGMRLLKYYRGVANNVARAQGLSWSDGDLWRLTKAMHNGAGFWTGTTSFKGFFALAKQQLGHTPGDWSEMFNAVVPSLASYPGLRSILNNATGVGGITPGASGQMVTKLDAAPVTAPKATAAPPAPAAGASVAPPPVAAPAPVVSTADAAAVEQISLDVYHLYAKFEYFRERYAKRTGSVRCVWNPYIVPGFPGVIFDQRASRVDLMVYITSVQHMMSHSGQRSTDLSFMYGRQLQEMFELMSEEFSLDNATARGTAPEEPIHDVSKITQSFVQAESYYQKLFYGAQQLYGKSASFDFRDIVAMQSQVVNNPPDPIFVDGPDVATQDANMAAADLVKQLSATRDQLSATVLDLQSRVKTAQDTLANAATPSSTYPPVQSADASQGIGAGSEASDSSDDANSGVDAFDIASAQQDLTASQTQLTLLQAQLSILNTRITAALLVVQGTENTSAATVVSHNLDDAATRVLVPAPLAQQYFDSRDAAMRYNWRPICTLDEYVVFYDTVAEGAIPSFGHPRSVGARFFDRIRRLTPPPAATAGGKPFVPPPGADGLGNVTSVPGLSSSNFPQIAADWDAALIAYRNNVLNTKAPRT